MLHLVGILFPHIDELEIDTNYSNRPSLSENVNSTPGILRVVVTGNFNVYRPDTLRAIDLISVPLYFFFCSFTTSYT